MPSKQESVKKICARSSTCREDVTGEGVLDGLGRASSGPPSLDFARTDYAVGGKHKG
jgi:hypothetical protein